MTDSEEQPLTRREARKLAKREAKLARARKKDAADKPSEAGKNTDSSVDGAPAPVTSVQEVATSQDSQTEKKSALSPQAPQSAEPLDPLDGQAVGVSVEDEFDFLLSKRAPTENFGRRSDQRKRTSHSGVETEATSPSEADNGSNDAPIGSESSEEETFQTPDVFPKRSARPSVPVTFAEEDESTMRRRRTSYLQPKQASDAAINTALTGEDLDMEPEFLTPSVPADTSVGEEPSVTDTASEPIVTPEPVIPVEEFLIPDPVEESSEVDLQQDITSSSAETDATEESEPSDLDVTKQETSDEAETDYANLTPLQRALATGQLSPDMVKSAIENIQGETQSLEIISNEDELSSEETDHQDEDILDAEVVSEDSENDTDFDDLLADALEKEFVHTDHALTEGAPSQTHFEDDYIAAILGTEQTEEPAQSEQAEQSALTDPTEQTEPAEPVDLVEPVEQDIEIGEEDYTPPEDVVEDQNQAEDTVAELVEEEPSPETDGMDEKTEVMTPASDTVIDPVAEAFKELAEAQGLSLATLLGEEVTKEDVSDDALPEKDVTVQDVEDDKDVSDGVELYSSHDVEQGDVEQIDVEQDDVGKDDVNQEPFEETNETSTLDDHYASDHADTHAPALNENVEDTEHPDVAEAENEIVVPNRNGFIPGMAAAQAALDAARSVKEPSNELHITDLTPFQDDEKVENQQSTFEAQNRTGSVHIGQSLVLPERDPDIRGPLSNTGEIVLTGTIGLPSDFGETGSFTPIDSKIDDEDFEHEFAAILDPMKASSSISAQSVEGDRRALEPQEDKPSKKRAYAIGLGVVAVAASGLLIYALIELF